MNASISDEGTVESQASTWSPMRNRLFATLILTHLFTQLGVFMSGLGGAWILTDLTDSPSVISLLQIAVAFPTFLLALITGALADIVDRKRIIVVSQAGIVLVAALFAVLSALGAHNVVSVIGLTAALGVLTALSAPAWIAIIPGLVGRNELAGAMTLSSAGVSAAMAAGPAIGGFVIAAAGPTYVFVLNVVVFAAGLAALRTWQPAPRTGLPAEHLAAAIRGGLAYVRYDRSLKIVIAKIVPFALVGTALVSPLPAIARFRLDAGPALFGLLSGAGGIGAVIALAVMPTLRDRMRPDAVVLVAMALEAATFGVLATTTNVAATFLAMVAAGAATLALISTVMTVLQVVLPAWIRGRGVAVYLLVLQGSLALGAFIWGAVAERLGLAETMGVAAVAAVVGGLVTLALRVDGFRSDATEAATLAVVLPTSTSLHDSDGPIVVTAAWQIRDHEREAFLELMRMTATSLRRQGALRWQLAEDVESPGVIVESFVVPTWSEFQRLPERTTQADLELEQGLLRLMGERPLPKLRAHRVLNDA